MYEIFYDDGRSETVLRLPVLDDERAARTVCAFEIGHGRRTLEPVRFGSRWVWGRRAKAKVPVVKEIDDGIHQSA